MIRKVFLATPYGIWYSLTLTAFAAGVLLFLLYTGCAA